MGREKVRGEIAAMVHAKGCDAFVWIDGFASLAVRLLAWGCRSAAARAPGRMGKRRLCLTV